MVGPAVSDYRHGRYSKYLPARMAAKYREAEHDPDLLSLRQDVAFVDARLSDLLSRVDTGESGVLWTRLQKAYEEFREQRMAGDVPRMTAALARMEAALTAAQQDRAAWGEIAELLEQRRKLVEAEHKRLVSLQQLITTERAMVMIAKITDIVTRHVADPKALSAIVVDLQQLATATVPVYGAEEA